MTTISEQLTQLESDRQDLVDNLETKGITGLTGDETFTELVPEVLNIQTGGSLDEYFASPIGAGTNKYSGLGKIVKKIPDNTTVSGTSLSYAFYYCSSLTTIPLIDTSSVTKMDNMFQYCSSLTTIPALNTSSVTNMNYMFQYCSSLTTIPLINTSSVTSMTGMFGYCYELTTVPALNTSSVTNMNYMFIGPCTKLTNESLNNILKMCSDVSSNYTGTKTLYTLFNSNMASYYPSATIQSLSNYQDFVNAGWSIGW